MPEVRPVLEAETARLVESSRQSNLEEEKLARVEYLTESPQPIIPETRK